MPAISTLNSIFQKAVDSFTDFITWISSDHRYIHEGKGFSYVGNSGSLAAGAKYALYIKTPIASAGAYLHIRPAKFSPTANTMTITIAEASTVTGGTVVSPINRNRNSSKLSKAIITAGVTVSVVGTVLEQDAGGGGSNPSNNTGGDGGANQEIVLKPDTGYSVEIVNVGATTASTAYFELFWYEEPKA